MKSTTSSSTNPRLDLRLAAYAAAGVALAAPAMSSTAQAAVVSSGPLSLAVPQTLAGIYLDLATGVTSTTGSFTGYDINPYSSSNTLRLLGGIGTSYVAPTTAGPASALTLGSFIGSTDVFTTSSTATNFFGTGTEYLGIQFVNTTTAAINYGWIQFSTTAAAGFPATITGYAYENTGGSIAAGQTSAVPEPTTNAALGLGALALGAVAVRRMRQNKQTVA